MTIRGSRSVVGGVAGLVHDHLLGENITEQWHVSYYVGTPDSMAAGGGGRGGGGNKRESVRKRGTLLHFYSACGHTSLNGRGEGGEEGEGEGRRGREGSRGRGREREREGRRGRGRGRERGKGEGGEEGEGEGEGRGRGGGGGGGRGGRESNKRESVRNYALMEEEEDTRTTMEGRRGRGRGRVLQNLLIHNVYGHIHVVNDRRGGGGGE